MSIAVQSFELPPIGTQCYVVSNTETQEMAVFDAPLNAWATVETLSAKSGYRISGLYLTHGHWDHTLDGQKFNLASVPTFAHAEDRLFYETPEIMATFSVPGMKMPPVEIGTWLEHGERITIVGRTVEVRHVPGHSPGSVLFWFVDDKVAISGDALFSGSIGRTDFPGCSFEQLANSIKKQIYTLPDDTIVYPGHGPETSVGQEAVRNPFVAR